MTKMCTIELVSIAVKYIASSFKILGEAYSVYQITAPDQAPRSCFHHREADGLRDASDLRIRRAR